VAAGAAQQVDLFRQAVQKTRAQFRQQHRIIARGSGERLIEITCFVNHSNMVVDDRLSRGLSHPRLWYLFVMTGRKNLVAVDSDSVTAPDHLPNQEVEPMDQAVMDDFLPTQEEWAEEENRRGSWLAPALALGAVAAWTAFFAWA